ncbi:MAG: P63C domain-containing protein, partial [Steroidobacteraceae bacterium]
MSEEETKSPQAAGGIARAQSLTREERKRIASKAAAARWDKSVDVPQAQYSGTLKLGDMSFPCSVLSDGSRVLTQSDFMHGMRMYYSGWVSKNRSEEDSAADIPQFLSFKSLSPFVNKHLGDLQSIILVYRTERGALARGIRAEIIPKICEIWLDAEEFGKLGTRQKEIAMKAKTLMRALAHTGIIALVDEATGYQAERPKDALQKYLEMIVRKELAVWAKKFPDEFYENIYKLRGWIWPGMGKNRYSVVAHYTRDLVYERMAPGLLLELESKSPQDDKGQRENKLHQWLSEDVGDPMLASHLQSILTLQRLALANGWGWQKFMNMVNQIMKKKGDNLDLPFSIDDQPTASQPPSLQS